MIVGILNKVISKLKGNSYQLDSNISSSYLIKLVIRRALMLLRGKISFIRNQGMLFIGSDVTLRGKSKMNFGKGVTIDDACFIDALSKDGIVFGNNVSLSKRTVIECSGSLKFLGKGFVVGDNVGLGRDCFYGCAGGIKIGSDTIIGNYVSLHSENHNITDIDVPIRLQGVNHKGIEIGENCWIGAKVTILDGVLIGAGCIFAAGSVVVSGKYETNGIYGGVPAKLLKMRT